MVFWDTTLFGLVATHQSHSFTRKKSSECFLKIFVHIYQITCYHIPDDHTTDTHSAVNHKSLTTQTFATNTAFMCSVQLIKIYSKIH